MPTKREREHYDTALHKRKDGNWECFSAAIGRPLMGYCVSSDLLDLIAAGHPLEGISWFDIWNKEEHYLLASVLARCPWITEKEWEDGRNLRISNKEKFHFYGHRTEEEAIACYQNFLSDFGLQEVLL